ncbi:MAG TPA: RagB/SusD family nutrient uptake outer membrane protein [Gemmatimonadales bacterium]
MTPTKVTPVLLAIALLEAAACNYDIANPNSPAIIGENPSAAQVSAAANGILIATRQDVSDWALDAAIFGREAFRIDPADPRFVQEMMQGPLDPGSRAFGGDHWLEEYSAIRSANDLLAVIGTASSLTAEQQNATRGFAHTLQAYNFTIILDSHTQDQIPIDVGTDASAPPAAFVTNAEAWNHVIALLDQGATELAGAAFPFVLPAGFTGFNTPATFLQFNRALRARVAVYRGDYAGALTFLSQSFLNPAGSLDLGVYMDYSTGAGDLPNPLAVSSQTSENFGHPTLETQAQLQPGGALDQRFLNKLVKRPSRSGGTTNTDPVQTFSSDLGWIRYPSPNSPIPLIRNEELILLRAEAELGLSDFGNAVNDINLIRQTSGLLAPYVGAVDQPSLLAELLYNKRYSLMYEGGHSWIDYRRYGLTANLQAIDRPGPPPDVIFPTLPIPTAETQPRT